MQYRVYIPGRGEIVQNSMKIDILHSCSKTVSHPITFQHHNSIKNKNERITHYFYTFWEPPSDTPSVLHIYSPIIIDSQINSRLILRSLTHCENNKKLRDKEMKYEILENTKSCVFNRDISGLIMDQWQMKIENGNWSKPFTIKSQTISLRV